MAIVYSGFIAPGPGITLSFSIAGMMVTVLSLYVFWRTKVPDFLGTIGLERGATNLGAALLRGLAAGAVTALLAWLYLQAIANVELFSALQEEVARLRVDVGGFFWLALTGIVVAPIFEEYIFRGLVYRGLRRSYGPLLSILGSAALFAIVHPPISVIPVFVLGLAAGWSFERSRHLIAPIAAHMIYNVFVFSFQSS